MNNSEHDNNLSNETMLPFVSLIVITKNNINTIEECIVSLLNQTYSKKKLEILFVDGFSTDETDSVIKKYVNKNSFCSLFYEDSGKMGYARNLGASKSKGSIIAFTDADAVDPKNWVKNIVAVFIETKAVAVGGMDILVSKSESDKIIDSWRRLKKAKGPKAIPLIKTVNFAITREALLSCGGFDPNLSHLDETELLARLYSKTNTDEVIYDPEIVVYHKRPNSISISKRIRKVFNKSMLGTHILLRGYMIKIVVENPISTLATSFYLVLVSIVAIPLLFLSIATGYFVNCLLFSLVLYLTIFSGFLVQIFRNTKKANLNIPFLLTIDFLVRFFGTFLGLIITAADFLRGKR